MAKRASTPGKKSKTTTAPKKSTASKSEIDSLKHFAYLASSQSDEALLKLIFESAKASQQNKAITIELKNGFTIQATAPSNKISSKFPKTFSAVLKKHGSVVLLKGNNIILELGITGIFDTETLEDNESPILDFVKNPKDLIFPLSEWQDCWVYNPSEKNETQEPVIYFLSHETLEPTGPQECNIGSLFLQRCASHLKIVRPQSKSKNETGPIEIIARANTLFKDARCVNLETGKILMLKKNEVSIVEFSSDNFRLISKCAFPLPILPLVGDDFINCFELEDGTIILEIESSGIFSLQLKNNILTVINTIEQDYEGRGAVIINNSLCFYENNPPGFHLRSLSNFRDQSFLKIKSIDINSAVNKNNLMVFAGVNDIFGFELASKQVKQIFKTSVDFSSPVIKNAPVDNQFIVFDSGTTAITLFKCEKGLKRVNSFHEHFNALQWCWAKSTLHVFLHDYRQKKHFIGTYSWRKGVMKIDSLIEVSLKNPGSETNWVWPMHLRVELNTMHIINADGMVWDFPLK